MAMERLTDDERDAVEANLGLVGASLKRFAVARRSDDAKQEGAIVLMRLVKKHDVARGRLSSLAFAVIPREVAAAMADSELVRVPDYTRRRVRSGESRSVARAAAAGRPMLDVAVLPESDTPAVPSSEAAVDHEDELAAMRAAVASVGGLAGDAIRGRLAGRTFEEIGSARGVTKNAARQAWVRGVKALRTVLANANDAGVAIRRQ